MQREPMKRDLQAEDRTWYVSQGAEVVTPKGSLGDKVSQAAYTASLLSTTEADVQPKALSLVHCESCILLPFREIVGQVSTALHHPLKARAESEFLLAKA